MDLAGKRAKCHTGASGRPRRIGRHCLAPRCVGPAFERVTGTERDCLATPPGSSATETKAFGNEGATLFCLT